MPTPPTTPQSGYAILPRLPRTPSVEPCNHPLHSVNTAVAARSSRLPLDGLMDYSSPRFLGGVFSPLSDCCRVFKRGARILTESTKLEPWTAMTSSMGLKFTPQRKHRARLVFGFVAVWNSLQRGQRKRR